MTLRNLMTPELVGKLRRRETTVRALAAELGVSESWLSRNYAGHIIGKLPTLNSVLLNQKRELAKTRKEYRLSLAAKVISHELSVHEAASAACCTVRTMYRAIEELR